jgi:hypothetical protein
MTSINDFRRAAGATGVTIVGTVFFFTIIGVFGLRPAIVGLLVFILAAVVIYRVAPAEGAEP